MTMSIESEHERSFQFKASFLPYMTLQIMNYHLEAIEQQLLQSIQKAPNLFVGSAVVIDLEKVKGLDTIQFAKLKALLASHGLACMGVRNGSQQQQEAAMMDGLSVLPSSKSSLEKGAEKLTHGPQTDRFAKCITGPVRSGTQVYAKETDLIVTAAVSPGAELFADGHIHIYGAMRGRALAGVQGNKDARIFCHIVEAELISIAGYYLTKEDLQSFTKIDGMTQIYLDNTQIRIEPI